MSERTAHRQALPLNQVLVLLRDLHGTALEPPKACLWRRRPKLRALLRVRADGDVEVELGLVDELLGLQSPLRMMCSSILLALYCNYHVLYIYE